MTKLNIQYVLIDLIEVKRAERQRRKLDIETLKNSIARNGLLQPIVVEVVEGASKPYLLVAGERRLESCKALGWTSINVVLKEDLSPIQSQILELEENLRRVDLTWQENVDSIKRIHALFCSADSAWTMSETAKELNLSTGVISMNLKIGQEMEGNARLVEAGTAREAYNIILRKDSRSNANALEELISDTPAFPQVKDVGIETDVDVGVDVGVDAVDNVIVVDGVSSEIVRPKTNSTAIIVPLPKVIQNQSFLDWAPTYSGPKFNLIHCDFPYGINLFNGAQGRGSEPSTGYTDDKDVYFNLLDCLCDNLDNFTSLSAHLVFWYSARYHEQTLDIFRRKAPSWKFHHYPLIWFKTDNAGIANDPRRTPRHVYETALFASRGNRQIVKIVADAYGCPTDHRLHPSTKPEPMLNHFLSMLVDGYTSILDPTCGSASALRAAHGLGASNILGLEIDAEFASVAQKEFDLRLRLKRAAEAAL